MSEDKEDSPSEDTVAAPEKPSDERTEESKGVRRGRPRKADVAAKLPGGRKQVGRPKGEKALMDYYKARLLNAKKSRRVLDKVVDTALEDGHPHQAACMKMVLDRIIPAKAFEDAKGQGGAKVQINFIGMDGKADVSSDSGTDPNSIVDGEFVEIVDTSAGDTDGE